jgi:hypothetical protein
LSIYQKCSYTDLDIRNKEIELVRCYRRVGHMRGHAMVATNYAIKAVGLSYKSDMNKITEAREWQLSELMKYIK